MAHAHVSVLSQDAKLNNKKTRIRVNKHFMINELGSKNSNIGHVVNKIFTSLGH